MVLGGYLEDCRLMQIMFAEGQYTKHLFSLLSLCIIV